MRVALVLEYADAARGGAETSALELGGNLQALGLSVTLVCARPATGLTPSAPPNRTGSPSVHFIDVGTRTRRSATLEFLFSASRMCRQEHYDIVHALLPMEGCHVYQPRGGTYAETIERTLLRVNSPIWRALKRWGRRLNLRQQALLRAESRLLERADPPHVACVSEYVRRQIFELVPQFPPDRCRVVFNGVDANPLEEKAAAAARQRVRASLRLGDGPVVLFVAHNFRLKGLAELMTAMSRGGEAQLVVAGRDRDAPFAALARRLKISSRVRFVGTRWEVRDLYAAADVLAHPTWYDPCSRVVLEALGCGLPVVTTRWNGAAEAMDPARHGAIVECPRDADALASAIQRCLSPELAAACRGGAPEFRARFSMEQHARALKRLYESIAADV